MEKYGLERGIRGSEARHITTPQYYRELYAEKEDLKEDIAYLEEQKQEVNDKIRDMYDHRDEAKEKFLAMHEFNKQKESEIAQKEQRLEQLQRDYEPYKGQEDLNLLLAILPTLGENLRMAQLCKGVGLTVEATQTLFRGETVSYTGKLHSPEHDRDFEVQDAKLQILKERGEPNEPNRYRLSLNGKNILDWFREQFNKLKQVVRPYIRQTIIPKNNNSKGYKR
jgi:DNA repair exonuclease SbcCD ATPase subunit